MQRWVDGWAEVGVVDVKEKKPLIKNIVLKVIYWLLCMVMCGPILSFILPVVNQQTDDQQLLLCDFHTEHAAQMQARVPDLSVGPPSAD